MSLCKGLTKAIPRVQVFWCRPARIKIRLPDFGETSVSQTEGLSLYG